MRWEWGISTDQNITTGTERVHAALAPLVGEKSILQPLVYHGVDFLQSVRRSGNNKRTQSISEKGGGQGDGLEMDTDDWVGNRRLSRWQVLRPGEILAYPMTNMSALPSETFGPNREVMSSGATADPTFHVTMCTLFERIETEGRSAALKVKAPYLLQDERGHNLCCNPQRSNSHQRCCI